MTRLKLIMALAAVLLFAIAIWSRPAATKSSSSIVINGQDDSWLTTITQSPGVGIVSPRAISEYADATLQQPLVSVPDALQPVLAAVRRQVIAEYADGGVRYDLAGVPGVLGERLRVVTARVIAEYNDGDYVTRLVYPKELINDQTAPVVSGFKNIFDGSTKITWTTDEFARCTVHYGTQPGNYTGTIEETLYAKQHEATLADAVAGTTYYVQITGADQSGNGVNSAEFSFTVVTTRSVFLPTIHGRLISTVAD